MEKCNIINPLPKTSCSGKIPAVSDEKWQQIFGKLKENDISEARMVCPHWRSIIDNLYNFSITIRGRPFEELPVPFKVTTCSIYQLKKDADKIFKYPDNVESLKLVAKINPSTLRNIFKETSNLKAFDFANYYDTSKQPCMPEESLHFKNLLQLKVHNNKENSVRRGGDNVRFRNTQRIFSYEMPALQRLDLRMIETWETFDNILPSFFKFLAKHSKTIKQLRASFISDLSIRSPRPLTPLSEELFNEMQPQNIMQRLHDPEFQLTTLIVSLPTRYLRLWERIINNQNKLITLYTGYAEDEFRDVIHVLPIATIQPTLARNECTLVNLHLTELGLQRNREPNVVDPRRMFPIDGLIFQDIKKLRRLILRRSRYDMLHTGEFHNIYATFVNLSSIPVKLLEVLEIRRLVCETRELERLVENAPRLKIVILKMTGNSNGRGVTLGIIDNVLKKSDIQIIDAAPIILRPDKTEAEKKLAELEKQYPQAIQLVFEGYYRYYFNFDRFRKGLPQETYVPYEHPLFFE